MKSLNLLLSATALCIGAMGCKTPTKLTYLPNHEPAKAAVCVGIPTNGIASAPDGPLTLDTPFDPAWGRDPKTLEAFTIHFDYDSSVVKSEETLKLQHITEYLKANSADALSIEGHCDEQGTEEYNRSLGDRRALALREALAKLDVLPARMDTISYGKDRPADANKTQEANRVNRRGEFVVLTPPK